MNHEQTSFILERFFFGWKISVAVYDADDCMTGFWSEEINLSESEYKGKCISEFSEVMRNLYKDIRAKCREADYPVIHMGEDSVYYMTFMDKSCSLFILGPASADMLSFSQQMNYRKRYHISNQKYKVPQVPLAKALNGLSIVYYMLTGRRLTEDDIMRKNYIREKLDETEVMTYQIQNLMEEKQHFAYRDELQWVLSIENGTLDGSLDDRLTPENLESLERVGTFSNTDSLKQCEYMVVTSTCLASRAAIRGGVNAYEAYMQSELFLQKISVCTDVMELLSLHMQIANKFSSMVREAQKNRAVDCVEQCKDYIARHRTQKFSLSKAAEAVGKSEGYLSRIFSERTGMSMQEYAMDLRLEAAANILRHSNAVVGEIAEYLSFPSQSYFGERFKKKYGVSPAIYRKRNKIRDFEEINKQNQPKLQKEKSNE